MENQKEKLVKTIDEKPFNLNRKPRKKTNNLKTSIDKRFQSENLLIQEIIIEKN